MINTDLAIIGAGPVGLFAAYYAGFRGLRSVVVDSLTEVGGQVSALYPEKIIEDVAGMPGIKGLDLITNLRQQADRFSPAYLLGTTVTSLEHEAEGVVLETDRDVRVRCKALIIAAGIGRFTPRSLAVGDEFHGRGLSYFVTDLESLAGQDVIIVGGATALSTGLSRHPTCRPA
ncbi:NAD(P)/FAD-dependent oxidoreductase [Microbacterium sp. NIBRBAC000506063]|uniref:NAD(P)/FAD-dependent oxidoreductase n=1 Tax=Microbacterium sp. NIBRBAC000506063 TaxID=2734618 RepID=UPI001BB725FF|nr:NAD(P)/FAD-dependent oxidoreductase [Microbacterium sp. NIBRBAC000506063]QTV80492.1 NAD(P)/FAD-dependent oxidoreductase [Microbacterium sp. NIBRBAC000506063]